jgi:hypothetical protein
MPEQSDQERAASVLNKACVPDFKDVYTLGEQGQNWITVSAQQRRALNLVWALHTQRLNEQRLNGAGLDGIRILVFGAGAGGLTCAAAAKLLGASVGIFDRSPVPMHVQHGCRHRFLHPRIAEWPAQRSSMASANLPILSWQVGLAHDVRDQIVSEYVDLTSGLSIEHIRDFKVSPERNVSYTLADQSRGSETPNIVILALGFGVEHTIGRLPPRSYWRADPLDQTALDTHDWPRNVLVCGGGDGGVTDFLRATLQSFDHGPFIDHVCVLLEGVRNEAMAIERSASSCSRFFGRGESAESALSAWLGDRYGEIDGNGFEALDKFLVSQLRTNTQVTWCGPGRAPHGMLYRTQPLHRILAWRLLAAPVVRQQSAPKYPPRDREERIVQVDPLNQDHMSGPRFQVNTITCRPGEEGRAESSFYHDVTVRTGPRSNIGDFVPNVFAALKKKSNGAHGEPPEPNQGLLQPAFDLFWEKTEEWKRRNPRHAAPPSKASDAHDAHTSKTEPGICAAQITKVGQIELDEIKHEIARYDASKKQCDASKKFQELVSEYSARVLYYLQIRLSLDSQRTEYKRHDRIKYLLATKHPDPERGPLTRVALRGEESSAYPCTIFTFFDYEVEARSLGSRVWAAAVLSELVSSHDMQASRSEPVSSHDMQASLKLARELYDAEELRVPFRKVLTRYAHRPER